MALSFKAEPAAWLAAASAAINLAIAFGAHLTVEQVTLLNVFLTAVVGVAVRQSVVSQPTSEQRVADAKVEAVAEAAQEDAGPAADEGDDPSEVDVDGPDDTVANAELTPEEVAALEEGAADPNSPSADEVS